MTPVPDILITSRSEYLAALKAAFVELANSPSREVLLCDENFAEWPLGEREVIEQLTRWAASSRRLTLLARSFEEVARRHPRWVTWRRDWSHIVTCRTNTELAVGEFPTVFWTSGTISLRLSDTVHHRGRLSHGVAEAVRSREQIDAVLQRSEEAFPATTTGL